MGLDRNKARTWSKDRIKEELRDLRRLLAENEADIRYTQLEAMNLERDAEERQKGGDSYCTHEKTLDAMGDYTSKLCELTRDYERDIEFLKTLL